MGRNLIKTPLTAVIWAALFFFAFALMPWSEGFRAALDGFSMPLAGYLLTIVCGLWSSLAVALLFAGTHGRGAGLLLPLLGFQWGLPLFEQLLFGETTQAMSQSDTLLLLAAGCAAGILLFILSALLFPPIKSAVPAAKAPPKYKIKPLGLIIRALVLPVIFCVLYFLFRYYLLWHVGEVRAYYGGTEDGGFIAEMVAILLTNARMVPMALGKGFLCVLLSIPLMLGLQEKRTLYIAVCTMLCASGALLMLLPSPLMPDTVRMSHLAAYLAIYLPYGAFTAFLLHTGLTKLPAPAAHSAPGAGGRQPAAAGARTPAGAAAAPAARKK